MSELIYILKENAVDKLRNNIDSNIAKYESEKSPDWQTILKLDECTIVSRVEICGSLEKCFKGLPSADDASTDADYCEAIYKALKNLTPQQATDERLWAYLTHFVFWDYVKARWKLPSKVPKPQPDKKHVSLILRKQKSIHAHFFMTSVRGMVRDNALSRLWWMAHVCNRVEEYPLMDVLNALLRDQDVRKEIMERATFARSTPILNALMKFLIQSNKGNGSLHKREHFRKFSKLLNRKGGVRMLDSMDQQQLEEFVKGIIINDLKLDPEFPKGT